MKGKNSVEHLFCKELNHYKGSMYPKQEGGPSKLLPGNYTQHLRPKPPELCTVTVSTCVLSQLILYILAFTMSVLF